MAYFQRTQARRCNHAAFVSFPAQNRCRLGYRLTLAGYTRARQPTTETVMKFAAAIVGLLLLASPARAEVDTPTLDSCKRVTADAERLKCYDKAASAPSPKPSEAEMGEAGWWIILGSIDIGRDNNITAESGRKREIVERAAAKCGYQAFNDYSMKFKGMASGYNVVVLGPYRSKSAAGNILESVRRCVPDAYVRQTEYAGE
ncbi:hypothetical protein [Bradyrhizobium sp. Ash2021]|uniref:hypothetical protein n=1 Tax=Bradyrhizobium sp. Ash2021 TaxID=2954771 RepID=UPI00281608A2|nr:hypothetical protein [Bradyrhizobium sp. Ash2021]WMT72394.1 hypothetical protein NL528_30760 [Bradyrhizobium sp. Ash2021]